MEGAVWSFLSVWFSKPRMLFLWKSGRSYIFPLSLFFPFWFLNFPALMFTVFLDQMFLREGQRCPLQTWSIASSPLGTTVPRESCLKRWLVVKIARTGKGWHTQRCQKSQQGLWNRREHLQESHFSVQEPARYTFRRQWTIFLDTWFYLDNVDILHRTKQTLRTGLAGLPSCCLKLDSEITPSSLCARCLLSIQVVLSGPLFKKEAGAPPKSGCCCSFTDTQTEISLLIG